MTDHRDLTDSDDGSDDRRLIREARLQVDEVRERRPDFIGGYRIAREIGRGAMGIVYRAEQPGTGRDVALKVLRSSFATPNRRRRFRNEGGYLGRLDHPGIARVLEVDVADDPSGPIPFIAMELVDDAQPITDYARANRLDLRSRIELLVLVTDAVQHAHQNGIVHRDLKPANIVVDASGRPRVLDFGVARVTDHDLQLTSVETEAGRLVGSLHYMSPEQTGDDPARIDTRSDVYGLGVVGYELLAGRLPYGTPSNLVHEMVLAIREDEPVRLGTVDRALRGDVETIIMRALEKDPDRRYQSASDLGGDLERFLRDEPINARPATASYQMRKFARRHRGAVAAGLAMAMVLVAATIVSSLMAAREAKARRSAVQVAAFFRDALDGVDPLLARSTDTALFVDMLARSEQEAARLDAEPAVVADVEHAVGRAFLRIGRGEDAVRLLEQAREGVGSALRLRIDRDLALAYEEAGRGEEAEALLRRTITGMEDELGPRHPSTLGAMADLGAMLEAGGRREEARDVLSRVRNVRDVLQASPDRDALRALSILASSEIGSDGSSESMLREAWERQCNLLGPDHPVTLATRHDLAAFASSDDCETPRRQVYEGRDRVLGSSHPRTIESLRALIECIAERPERRVDTIPLLADLHRAESDRYGPDDERVLRTQLVYGETCLGTNRIDEGAHILDDALRRLERVHMGGLRAHTVTQQNIAIAFALQYRYDEAFERGEDAYEDALRIFGPDHVETKSAAGTLGQFYLNLARSDEARVWFERAGERFPGDS